MQTVPFRLTGLLLVLGCQGAAEDPQPGTAGTGSSSGGSASGTGAVTPPTGGTSMAGSGSSTTGGHAGSVSPNGGTIAQGGGAGGRSSGAGTSGMGGSVSGGTAAVGGGGGTGSCVKNLACKLAAPASTGDIHQDCVDRINQFLTQCACLPALARNTQGEACADQMAEYDAGKNMAHQGTRDKICEPRGSQNECPGYSSNNQVISLCFQQMWDEGPPPTDSCTGDCYEEHGHFINMTDDSVTKVSCGFFTTASGKVWAVQNFFR